MIKHLHDSNNNRNNQKGKSGNHPEIRSDCHKVLENQNCKIYVYKTYIYLPIYFLNYAALCWLRFFLTISYFI